MSRSSSARRGIVARAAGLSLLLCLAQARADPPKGARWEPIPQFTDEFNAEKLDTKKWDDHNPEWKGREPGFFSKANVGVRDGKLTLTARAEDLPGLPPGYHTFTTAAVRSTSTVRYGYFEVRCRPMDSKASSAFWFYAITPERWTEIDVFEMGPGAPGHERKVHLNVHVFHEPGFRPPFEKHPSEPMAWEAPFKVAEDFHVYALEWDEQTIRWYVDGAVVRKKANERWHQPLYLNFDSETMPGWFGLPDRDRLPATFAIDYVRAWKKVEAPKGSGPG